MRAGPIRIMHVVDNIGRGGMQNGLVNLIRRLPPDRFEHVVCAMRKLEHTDAHVFEDRVRVVELEKSWIRPRIQVAALVRTIRRFRPDVVHSRNWSAVEGVLAGKIAGNCRLIHSEHGLDTAGKEPLRRRCFRRVSFSMADRIFCVSGQLRQLYAASTGFPEGEIEVIHNGVDTRRFAPDPAARDSIRREWGIAADELCIGAVGNLTPVKDHMTLLRGVARFAERSQKWRLFVIGEGAQLLRLLEFVNAHPALRQRVCFPGLSNRVPAQLNAFDAYVLSSLTEGICNTLLEAMATGLPVITTNTGGNPEVVDSGSAGLLFPVGDAGQLAEHLHRFEAQPDYRNEMGRRALQHVRERHSLESMLSRYEQLYESVARPGAVRTERVSVEV